MKAQEGFHADWRCRHAIDYLAINAVSGYYIAATSVQVCAVRPARSNTVKNVPIDKINEWTSSR